MAVGPPLAGLVLHAAMNGVSPPGGGGRGVARLNRRNGGRGGDGARLRHRSGACSAEGAPRCPCGGADMLVDYTGRETSSGGLPSLHRGA